jgi:CBS domain-containing protein
MRKKSIDELLVGDIYQLIVGTPAYVKKSAKLRAAVEAMINVPYSQKVYVVDKDNKLLGTITIATLLRQVGYRLGARKPGVISFFKFLSEIFKESVEEFMEAPVDVTKNVKIRDALQLMVENRLNNLPVVDEKGRLIGELNSIEILREAKNHLE